MKKFDVLKLLTEKLKLKQKQYLKETKIKVK